MKTLISIILSITITLSMTGCVGAVAEGVMQGTAQVAVEAGVESTVLDKEKLEKKRTIQKAQANVSLWKLQKLFGCGPLAEKGEK